MAHTRSSRALVRVAAALVGCSSLVLGVTGRAATPPSQDVGPAGSGYPQSITWAGGDIVGNPDPLGPPSPSCTTGCDRETFVLHAPSGFTTTNVIDVSATATFNGGTTGGTVDVAILDSNNDVLGSTTAAASPATATATDLQPGTYVVEVDGDIGDPSMTSYSGSLSVSSVARTAQPSHADGGITAGRETPADPYRLGTEPTIGISPDGTVYEGPIFGFSTTQSFLMRSDNDGETFNTLGIPAIGKLTSCPGGGDEDVATDPNNNLYFFDLGGAPVVPAAVSPDHGNTFIANCVANDTATDPNHPNIFPDRQWLTTDTVNNREWYIWRDGLVDEGTPTDSTTGGVYGEYIEYAPLPSGAAGLSQLTFTHLCENTTGQGLPCVTDVQIAGNAVTDNSAASPYKGTTYLAISRSQGVSVVIINPNSSPTVKEVTAAPGASNVLFPTVAVDKAGNIYEAYTDASTYQVMFTRSIDGGAIWSTPIAVNGAPAAVTVMPWIVAGDAGRVDLAFYGSPSTQPPTINSGPWNVYLLQDLNAASATPSFNDWTQAQMTDRANHVEPVCLSGLGCTTNTGPGGDRELGDFFRVALDGDGRAMIAFADGNNQLGNEVAGGPAAAPSFADFVRQATGPSLYGTGDVSPIDVPTNSVSVGAHNDPIPFAAPTGPGPSVDALNLLSSSMSNDGTNLHIHLVIKNLDATQAVTAPALATSTFLTRWWFNGQYYYAAAEDTAGQFSYFSGQVAPASDGAAIKYAYYPANGPASGSFTPGPNGTIDLTVPDSAVGNPNAGDVLYSVTSYTNTHASPTAPTPPTASNFTDFPQIVDVLPSYNVEALNSVLPEAPWTPVLIIVGIACLGFAAVRRPRAR